MKEIAFEWWNPTDTRKRSSVSRSFRLRSQKMERIRKNMFLISDCQWVSVSQDPSVSYFMKTMIIITFGIFLIDDIETLHNPRNSDESKTSNASICISSHSIFIETFPHTSDMDLVTYEKSININAYLMTRDDSKRRTNVTMQRFGFSVHAAWCMNEVKLSTKHDRREYYRKLFRHQITKVNKMSRYIWSVENHSI